MSKFYYEFTLEDDANVVIGVHQEDERILEVEKRRYYIDLSFSIFRKEDGELEFVEQKDHEINRQV